MAYHCENLNLGLDISEGGIPKIPSLFSKTRLEVGEIFPTIPTGPHPE
jgi:hypothetical protein